MVHGQGTLFAIGAPAPPNPRPGGTVGTRRPRSDGDATAVTDVSRRRPRPGVYPTPLRHRTIWHEPAPVKHFPPSSARLRTNRVQAAPTAHPIRFPREQATPVGATEAAAWNSATVIPINRSGGFGRNSRTEASTPRYQALRGEGPAGVDDSMREEGNWESSSRAASTCPGCALPSRTSPPTRRSCLGGTAGRRSSGSRSPWRTSHPR